MRNRIGALILYLLGFLYVTHKFAEAAPSQPACTPAANDPADSVDTANPYANDQDGCACVDPTDTSTCYCLVGYASNGANGCTATPLTVTDAGKCDPSADTGSGDDRTCICVDLVGEPGTAYLDPSTCYCKSGYTTTTGSTRLCTRKYSNIF
ncbi:uncharacterized protein LOC142355679 [Convolutriloba macropyga]|uniref:uncharacterized protein LOC142355679 n=1 Tax=Convolutriloba macropyga TaxID=536237 RepID=UPI003F5280A6